MEPQSTTQPGRYRLGRTFARSAAEDVDDVTRYLSHTAYLVVEQRAAESDEQAERLASALWLLERAAAHLRAYADDVVPEPHRHSRGVLHVFRTRIGGATGYELETGDMVEATCPAEAAELMSARVAIDGEECEVACYGGAEVYDVLGPDGGVTRWEVRGTSFRRYTASPVEAPANPAGEVTE